MKILFVASIYRHLTTFHLSYMRYFKVKGYEVWAAGASDTEKSILEEHGVRCVDIPFSRNPVSLKNITAYQKIKKLFKENSFELIHVHTPVAAFLARSAFRKSKSGKIVYTAHGFHFFKGAPKMNWIIYYMTEKLAARWTDHLITINEEDFKNAKKLLPLEKISFVHGVGVEFSTENLNELNKIRLKNELGLSKDSIVISYVAELNNNKNHQFLLRNWILLKQNNPFLELLIIGDGEKGEELKNYVLSENLVGIHFLGYRKDVSTLLQISDISALLSHREGLPKSIMEAMATGIPCVVTNTRGLRDLIENNHNGFVIDHENDMKLVVAFNELAQSEQLRLQMGQQAKKSVTPFLMENVLQEYISIYEQLLK